MSQNRTPGISACLDLRIQVRQTTEADVEWAISVGDRLIAAEHSTGLRPALESMQDEIAKLLAEARGEGKPEDEHIPQHPRTNDC